VAAVTDDPVTARRLVVEGWAQQIVVARPAHARHVQVPVAVVTDPPGRAREPDRPRRLR
jgi:hypothetical protein